MTRGRPPPPLIPIPFLKSWVSFNGVSCTDRKRYGVDLCGDGSAGPLRRPRGGGGLLPAGPSPRSGPELTGPSRPALAKGSPPTFISVFGISIIAAAHIVARLAHCGFLGFDLHIYL